MEEKIHGWDVLFVFINPIKMFLCLGASEDLKEKGQGKLSHLDLSKIKQVAMETTLFIYSVYSFSVPIMASHFLH